MKTLLGVAQWRWTPFFGIVGGTLIYVLLVALIVPTEIGGSKASKARGINVITDESPPITANMGGTSRAFPARTPPASRPPSFVPTSHGITPPPPMERPDPIPPPAREVLPEPPPPPPPPPQSQPEEEEEVEEEAEEEEEQGAAPNPTPSRAIAGALRMLPHGGRRIPAVAPPADDSEPEPDEPDTDE